MPHIQLFSIIKNYLSQIHSGVTQINLDIEHGQIVSIIGESGSGKSTLLKVIYGTILPQSGEVHYNGVQIIGADEKLIPGHNKMKMVSQDLTLNLYAKVYDNIACLIANTNLDEKRELTLQTMDFLRISHLADKRVSDLSGGEQQRVAIARAVITEPEVLLLDEPFSQLDAILKKQLREDVKRLAHYLNITVIMVSHDPIDGLSMADKIVVLKEGKIIRQGTPKAIYQNPQYAYVAKLLGKANILTNSNLLPNISQTYAIYPQHVLLHKEQKGFAARVKSTSFAGNFEEIEIIYQNLKITAYDYQMLNFMPNENVWFTITELMEVED
ncbi:MAG: ABC transporter ATP-binding protein [Sphingobacteriales bacterium]|nr:MAG: ABC transporter ATP-binding protein [Sphingobacteriales bacterium]TAF82295.1 MAG: ABC transporter ATP-binding protein [Sphingobacteriales bacterium]